MQFEVQAPQHEVLNLGELIATHGAAGVFAGTIRHSGVIEANTLSVDEAGAIVLSARSDIHVEAGSVIEAAGVRGGEINIESEEGATWVTGVLDASGSESVGGRVEVLGERVAVIAAARVDASGETGGGEILIGGDLRGENAEIRNAARTVVGADARLLAGAGSDGDGGKIIVWSDEMTKFAGRISATGGSNSGDGGFVETSGKAHLEANGMVDASAVTGLPGTWLLDPFDTDLSNTATFGGAFSGGDPNIFTPTSDNAVVNIGEVVTSLEGGTDVEVNTGNAGVQAGDITVVDSITANLTNGDVSLTLSAANDLGINAAITATGANTLTLTLVADNDLADGGGITIAADINTNGGLVDAASAGSGNVSLTGNRTITSDFDVTLLNIAGGIQTFDGTTNVVDLEQLGTISIPADRQMNLAGVMNWTAGNISGGGTLAIQPGGTVNQLVNGPNVFLSGATIDNQGTFNLSPVTQTFFFSANSVFDNQVGGVFNFQNDFDVLTSGAGGDFNNFGTVTKTGGNGSSGFAVRFNNQDGGSVDGGTGNVGLDATGTHSGALIGVGDARFNATQNMAAGSSIAGTLGLFGNLDVSNSPTVTGTLNWFAGSIVGAGALVIAPGGTVNQLVDGSNTFLSASTIDNQGTFNHNSGSNTFFFSAGGVFNNQAGGVFNFQNDFDVQASGGGGDFNNFGTVRKTGGGADSVFRVRFNNQDGGIVDGGTGNIGLNATGTQTGVFIGIGDVRFNALQNMAAGSSIAGTVGLFSNLDVTNGPTVTGTLNWFNGNVTGGGTLFIAPGGTVNQLVNGPNTFLSASTIDNQGTFNHNSGSNTFFFSAGGVFNNQAGGVFNFLNDFDVQSSGGGGTFNNAGTVQKTGGGLTSSINVTFDTNNGVIDAQTGTISVSDLATNNGTVSSATGAFIITSANLANFGTIAGNGTLNANVTNNAGGIIAPGQSGGALTISGTLNLLVNGDLDIELDGTSPGVGGHDQLIVTGATALAGDLNATLGFAVTNGNTFDFLTSAGGTSGTFDNVNLPTADFALSGEGTNTLTITFGGVCGADVCWTNAGPDLSWTTDANWSTGTKPGLLDNVLLPTGLGGTITLDTGAQTIATLISDESLVINGATLTVNGAALFNSPLTIDGGGILNLPGSGNRVTTTTVTSGIIDSDGDLAINTVLNLTAGIFRGAGTTTVASGAAFNVDGNFLFEDNDLVNNGTLTVSADLSLGLLNTVTNNSGGVIDITGDFDMVGGGSSVDNAGVWRKSGGASDSFSDLIVTNTGSIESQSGRFNLNGPGDHSGGTLFANTGSFVLTNSHSFDRDSSINGSGDLTASGNHNNAAVINKSTAGDTRYFVTTFNANSGSTINISAGSLTIDNFVNNFGTVTLTNNTTLNTAPTFVNRTGGLVQGVGTVDATTFINQGNVGPGNSPDILVINGDLDLDPTSVLDFEIGGTTPGPTGHDQIVVTGNVTLDGTINATLFGGFTPSDGNIFDIILGTIVGGSFATENLPVNFTLADFGDRVRLTFNSGAGCGGTICFDNSDLDFLWTKMNNWDLDRLPVPADIVVVDLGGGNTVVLDSGVQSISSLTSIENLDITGGTLTIANPSAFNGNVLIDGGTINGTGDINLNGNLTWRAGGLGGAGQVLNTNATTTLETPATKTILGNWTNSGGIDLDAGVLSVTGSVINQGFFNANSTTGGTITGAGNFLNDTTGTFNKATAGTTQVTAGTFDNDGMVSVTGGTLERTGGGNYTGGTFTADAGTFVEFGGGNYSFDAASQLVGPGRFRFNDGTHNVNAAFSTTPTVDLGDPLAIVALTNDLTGVILLVSQGTLNASTALDQLTFSGGVLNVTGGVDVNNMTWSGGNISGTGTLRNQGTIDYTGGTTTAALSNSGTLNVQSGTLALSVGATHGSDFDVSGGATLQLAGGTHDLTGNSTFTGAGTVDVAAAGTMKVSGNTTMSADLTCSGTVNGGGTLTFNGGTSNTIGGTYNVTGTTVVDTSTVNFTSAATFDTLDVNPGAAVTLSPAGTTVSSLDISGGTLTNNGGLATNGSSVLSGGTVQGTGSWNNNGSASLSGSTALTLTGNVNNSGALVKTGAGTSTFTNAAFANTGGVNVSAGTMQIDGGSVGGVGSITAPNVQRLICPGCIAGHHHD